MSRSSALRAFAMPFAMPADKRDRGFTLVEVMAAMTVFIIVSTASLTILVNSIRTIRENNDRVYAASLARSEVDRLRTLGTYGLVAGVATNQVAVGGKTFTVTTTSMWVPLSSTGAIVSCGSGNVSSDPNRSFARIRVEVTGGGLKGPQALDAVILPSETSSVSNVGTVTATVKDEASRPLENATVTMVNQATSQTLVLTTDAAGCVYARNVPVATTYTATASKTGYVTKTPSAATQSGTVLSDQNTVFDFQLATAGAAVFTAGATDWPFPQGVPFNLSPPGTATLPTGVPGVLTETPVTVTGLWPDPSAYTAWMGCSDAGAYGTSVPVTAGGTANATLGGTRVEILGPRSTEITIRHAATGTGACTDAITLSLGKTGSKGKLKATLPFGTWTVKASNATDKPVVLKNTTTSPCSVALVRTVPTLTSISPSSINIAGGSLLTIVGTNLSGATSVTVGGAQATIVSNTATGITAVAPARPAGQVDVVVTTTSGSDAASDAVTYRTALGDSGTWTTDLDTTVYPNCPAS